MIIYAGLEAEINSDDPTVRMIARFHHFLGLVLNEAKSEPDPWEKTKIYENALTAMRNELGAAADRGAAKALSKGIVL